MLKHGAAPNKAEVVRQALVRYAEEQAIAEVLRAEQGMRSGKGMRGDLRTLLKSE